MKKSGNHILGSYYSIGAEIQGLNKSKALCRFDSSSYHFTLSGVGTTWFYHVVIKIRPLFLRPAACLTSTLLGLCRFDYISKLN
jgi:hypothetical protein